MSATIAIPDVSVRSPIEMTSINTIRTLSMDAVQAANSGHPGTPMALAPVAYCLWQEFLRYDPKDPHWINRDRFVLSAGHASMLLYSLLHFTGVRENTKNQQTMDEPSVPLDEVEIFRQFDSRCPGHPDLTGRQESRPLRGRWGKALRRASGWPSRGSGLPRGTIAPASNCLTSTSTRFAETVA